MKSFFKSSNLRILALSIGLVCGMLKGTAQSFVFAELKGVPLNTTGWNLQGNAYVGNTGTNTGNGELILCNPVLSQSGSVFYNLPINLTQCNKWIAEFDFRIAEGTAADGIAFCYIDVPPVGFVSGGGLGIPATANGLKVCIDTWRNCGTDAVPKLEMRWGSTYDECAGTPTRNNNDGALNFIRSGEYHSCKIVYDKGNISLSINGKEYLTGFQTFNFQGYFGFTASTGGFTDKHSIKNVKIYTEMPPSFAGNDTSTCSGVGAPLGSANNSDYKYTWTPSTGLDNPNSSNPKATLSNTGPKNFVQRYYVRTEFAAQPGCASTDSVDVVVYPEAKPLLNFDGVCSGVPTHFSPALNWPDSMVNAISWHWKFNDPNSSVANPDTSNIKSPVHVYQQPGIYNVDVQMKTSNGCTSATSFLNIGILSHPKADFSLASEICFRDTSYFSDLSTAVNQEVNKYYWNFGDNSIDSSRNPGHKYTYANTFFVSHWVQSDAGCISDTVTKQHMVNPLPTPSFVTSSLSCERNNITFTDQSAANAGIISRWQWNLGDGTNLDVISNNPFTHTYATFGTKNTSLVVTSNKGCRSDTLFKPVVVHQLPKPDFLLPEVCLTDAFAAFTNSSSVADGSGALMTYLWNFGDPNASVINPNTSTAINPQHRYSAIGNYIVKLQATSGNGCMDTISQVLTVNGDKPKADFIVQNAAGLCSNIAVNIQNKSTVNFGSITKTEIYWEWPNAAIKTVDDNPVPDKVYSNLYANFQSPVSKTIQVKFVAYSGGVCVNEIIKDITLNASPRVVFQAIPGICLDATPRLITQASDAGNLAGAGTYTGAGVAANGLYTPTVAGVGTHTLKYMYVTTQGCRDSANQTITVWPRPTASFTVDAPMCETQPTTFRDASVANFSNILTWNWTFGDGTNSSLNSAAPFTHTYAANGTVNVQMQVITDSGCTSVPVVKAVKVNPLPKVDFTLPVVCMPAGKAQFTDKSSISDGTQAQFGYLWNFGIAGATSTLKDPVYYYPAVATYNVKLVVTSKDGCRDSATKQLTDVNPQPLSAFSFTPSEVCLGDAFTFTDNSNPLNQQITTWTWDFGDGKTTNTQNATHTYTAAGSYSVKLYYNSSKGCQSDTTMKTAVVNPYPVVSAGPDLHVLEGGQATIKATATGSSAYQYLWTPASYLSNPNVLQPITKPLADITYTLKVTGAGGCITSDDVFIKVLLAPQIPNAFSPNGDGINDTWNIKYIDSYPGAIIQVFDRYGRQVFYSVGYNQQWVGKLNGKDLPVGVYYYIIDPKNGRTPINGSVTLIR